MLNSNARYLYHIVHDFRKCEQLAVDNPTVLLTGIPRCCVDCDVPGAEPHPLHIHVNHFQVVSFQGTSYSNFVSGETEVQSLEDWWVEDGVASDLPFGPRSCVANVALEVCAHIVCRC